MQTDEGKGIHSETVLERKGGTPLRQEQGGEETLSCIYWCSVLHTKLYFLPFQISALRPDQGIYREMRKAQGPFTCLPRPWEGPSDAFLWLYLLVKFAKAR